MDFLRSTFKAAFGRPITYVALVFIPFLVCVFGFLYSQTFSDPYVRMENMPVAVVNLDEGTTVDGVEENYGNALVESIKENKAVRWTLEDSSFADEDTLAQSDYFMAVVIPKDFSATVAAGKTAEPEQAQVQFYRNVRKNFMMSLLGKNIEAQLREAINEEIAAQYAQGLAQGLYDAVDGLSEAADGSAALDQGIQDAQSGSSTLATGAEELQQGSAVLATATGQNSALATGADTLNEGLGTLRDGSAQLATGASSLSSGLQTFVSSLQARVGNVQDPSTLVGGAAVLETGSSTLNTSLGELSATGTTVLSSWDSLSDAEKKAYVSAMVEGINQTQAGASSLEAGAEKLSSGLSTLQSNLQGDQVNSLLEGSSQLARSAQALAGGADSAYQGSESLASGVETVGQSTASLASGAQSLSAGASSLEEGLGQAHDGAAELHVALAEGVDSADDSLTASAQDYGSYIAHPVNMEERTIGNLDKFGSGLAPLFLTICLWLGSLLTFFIFEPYPTYQYRNANRLMVILGRWPLYLVMALAVIVAISGVAYGVGLQTIHFGWFVLTVSVIVVSFLAILQFFSLFDLPGKALAILILIVQIVCASGTFPAMLGSDFSAAIAPWLPFTYAIDAYREVISGGNIGVLLGDLGHVALFGISALVLSLLMYPLAKKAKIRLDHQKLQEMKTQHAQIAYAQGKGA